MGDKIMQITSTGTDYIKINEDNLYDESLINISRVHLIQLDFEYPTEIKIKQVLKLYPKTKRYIINDNIRIYNYILRSTNKKYYIENLINVDIISFFRKNNKVLLNFNNLNDFEKIFFFKEKIFKDLLKNVEVIKINRIDFDKKFEVLNLWRGNVIII